MRRFFPALRGRRELDVDGRELGTTTGSFITGSMDSLAPCRSSDSLSNISGMIEAAPSFARTLSSCVVSVKWSLTFGKKKPHLLLDLIDFLSNLVGPLGDIRVYGMHRTLGW